MRFVFSIARSKNSGMEIEIINIDLQRDDFFTNSFESERRHAAV